MSDITQPPLIQEDDLDELDLLVAVLDLLEAFQDSSISNEQDGSISNDQDGSLSDDQDGSLSDDDTVFPDGSLSDDTAFLDGSLSDDDAFPVRSLSDDEDQWVNNAFSYNPPYDQLNNAFLDDSSLDVPDDWLEHFSQYLADEDASDEDAVDETLEETLDEALDEASVDDKSSNKRC